MDAVNLMNETGESEDEEEANDTKEKYDQNKQYMLSKRLAYVLRYGAELEGLEVLPGGYVNLLDLLNTKLMRHDSMQEVLREVEVSHNGRRNKRFEKKEENDTIYIRACYGRQMERSPYHEGTHVMRLLEITINYVANNINLFDLQDFPDEYLVNCIMHKLRRSSRLNNGAFASLLGSNLEILDLSDAVVTMKTIKLICQRCRNLKHLSLKKCGYIATDHTLSILLKNLTQLVSLNLSGCCHISDRTINAVVKYCPHMERMNLINIPDISKQALVHLVTGCNKLRQLDISTSKSLTEEEVEILATLSSQHNVTINIT